MHYSKTQFREYTNSINLLKFKIKKNILYIIFNAIYKNNLSFNKTF